MLVLRSQNEQDTDSPVLWELRAQGDLLKAKYHRRDSSKRHCICHQEMYDLIGKTSPAHRKYRRVSKSGMTNIYYAHRHLPVYTYVNKCRHSALSQDVAPASCPRGHSKQPLLCSPQVPFHRSTNHGTSQFTSSEERPVGTIVPKKGFMEKKLEKGLEEPVRNANSQVPPQVY